MTSVQNTSKAPSQELLDNVNGTRNAIKDNVTIAQDRFMKLLVEQMKNQDPLNPMDNAQVTSQMAQLSTVTGIDKLNKTLESLISSVQAGQSYQASSMIGRNVLVPGNKVITTGEGGYLGVELPLGADKLEVTIKDAVGSVIKTMSLGSQNSGSVPIKWDGRADDGSISKAGSYQFTVDATIAGQKQAATSLSYAEVLSISNSSAGVKLNLSNLTSANTNDVREIF